VGRPVGEDGPLAPVRVYGPSRPAALPSGGATFGRETTIHPERPAPGTADLVARLILSHYLPADLDAISAEEWAQRAGAGFSGITTAGRDGLRRVLPGAGRRGC
jgi:hypothetical protein